MIGMGSATSAKSYASSLYCRRRSDPPHPATGSVPIAIARRLVPRQGSIWFAHICFEEIRVEDHVFIGVAFPDILGIEADAVYRHSWSDSVRAGRGEIRIGSRINRIDDAGSIAQEARQARMLDRRRVLDEDLLADLEERLDIGVALWRVAFDQIGRNALVDRRIASALLGCSPVRQDLLRSLFQFRRCDVPIFNEIAGNTAKPLLVVAILEIIQGIERFSAFAKVGPGPHRLELAGRRGERQL